MQRATRQLPPLDHPTWWHCGEKQTGPRCRRCQTGSLLNPRRVVFLRLPADLHAKLNAAAHRDGRSVNQLLIEILAEAIDPQIED